MASTARSATELPRFSRAVRVVHRTVAVLMTVCILTAAVLYNSSLAIGFGHRRLFELVHVYSGLALPVPIVAGLLFRAYRDDAHRLNRFLPSDWHWLRSKTRRDGTIRVGKFNAGQKLNACLTAGSIAVLFGTGLLMFFPSIARLSWRSGATFAHDWFALALGLLVLGHVTFALKDPQARRGMRSGRVAEDWARAEHAAWAEEMGAPGVESDPGPTAP